MIPTDLTTTHCNIGDWYARVALHYASRFNSNNRPLYCMMYCIVNMMRELIFSKTPIILYLFEIWIIHWLTLTTTFIMQTVFLNSYNCMVYKSDVDVVYILASPDPVPVGDKAPRGASSGSVSNLHVSLALSTFLLFCLYAV